MILLSKTTGYVYTLLLLQGGGSRRWTSLLFLVLVVVPSFLTATIAATAAAEEEEDVITSILPLPQSSSPPTLSGQHFKITVVEEEGFITVKEEKPNGELSFSGYLIDILEELAFRANFSYELRTPSGFGSLCVPRLIDNATLPAYHSRYRQDYRCGESDVNDPPRTLSSSSSSGDESYYRTDFYWGAYYITPQRLQVNKFTIPYSPPDRASLGMMGTATHISTIHDLRDTNYKVCALQGTAYMKSLQISFPHLHIHGIKKDQSVHRVLEEGMCDIVIDATPLLKRTVLDLYLKDKCLANGKPIGIIGEPLEYGLNYFAFGIRMDLDDKIIQTLNFWLQALMACFPEDENGYCYGGRGSISQLYSNSRHAGGGGKGNECGYVQFPILHPPNAHNGLKPGVIAAIALTPVVLVLALGMIYHTHQLKAQERRMKRRFVQQLARNIDIGPSAGDLSATKLTETFDHIGGKDGNISKTDLATWMNDINLDFLSDNDFERLWQAMDMDGTGRVDPIDFFSFLKQCEDQFEQVHKEYSSLPRTEKVKLAARRLTNIRTMGFEEVQKMERRNNKRTRQAVVFQQTKSGRHLMSSSKVGGGTEHSSFDASSSCTNPTTTLSSDGSRLRLSERLPSGICRDTHFRISETAFQVASSITNDCGGFLEILQNEMSNNKPPPKTGGIGGHQQQQPTTDTIPPIRNSTTSVLPETVSDSVSGSDDDDSDNESKDNNQDTTNTHRPTATKPGGRFDHDLEKQQDATKIPRPPKPGRFDDMEKNFKEEITDEIDALNVELINASEMQRIMLEKKGGGEESTTTKMINGL